MSTATPRLQLTKPLGSESMVLGASQLNDAYSKIDAAVGVKKFATTGAATATFNGDLIFETSTSLSKMLNAATWFNIFDDNNGRAIPQEIDPGPLDDLVLSGLPELGLVNTNLNVEAGRKYLIHFNLNLSGQLNTTGGSYQGYLRITFRYGTNLAVDPTIFVHDVASYITAINPSKSKSFKGMFEFFPNVTGQVKFGIFGQVISGQQDVKLNLNGSIPEIIMVDWGV